MASIFSKEAVKLDSGAACKPPTLSGFRSPIYKAARLCTNFDA
jgi:hypothetical protein